MIQTGLRETAMTITWTGGYILSITQLFLIVANRYSDNSMMVTNFTGASATFCFNGTGVNVYGAKRGNHGSYQVTLDGTTFPAETGRNDTGIFQTLLFSSITLEQDYHELILTDQGVDNHLYLDIDYVSSDVRRR